MLDLAVGMARSPEHQGSRAAPMTPETVCLWMSSGKPITAVALAQRVETGDVGLQDPVAEYVEGFEAHGKDGILVEHLLTHTAGLRAAPFNFPEQSWDAILEVISASRPEPRWIPGERAGYHPQTAWYLLGQVLQAVTDEPVSQVLRERVFEPAGMGDCHVGLTDAAHDKLLSAGRLAAMHGHANDREDPARLTTQPWLTAPRPGGNLVGSARSMVRFYEMLLDGVHGPAGSIDGKPLLQPDTVARWTSRRRVGLRDETFKAVMDWGLGFMVNNRRYAEHDPARMPYGFGPYTSERAFGHGGHQSSIALADPEHGLALAVHFNGMPGESAHRLRMFETLGAVYEHLGLLTKAAS